MSLQAYPDLIYKQTFPAFMSLQAYPAFMSLQAYLAFMSMQASLCIVQFGYAKTGFSLEHKRFSDNIRAPDKRGY